jgi:molybdopterin converting factor small subunit
MRSPRGKDRAELEPTALAVELTLALVLSLSAIIVFASVWTPPAKEAGPPQLFVGSLTAGTAPSFTTGDGSNTASSEPATIVGGLDISQTITITVTARGSQRNIIGGSQIEVEIPKGGSVAQLNNRLTDRYAALEPYAMVAINGGMLPLTLPLSDGQTVELMAPHSAGLTFLGKPLPTEAP